MSCLNRREHHVKTVDHYPTGKCPTKPIIVPGFHRPAMFIRVERASNSSVEGESWREVVGPRKQALIKVNSCSYKLNIALSIAMLHSYVKSDQAIQYIK